jgi:hypothetical protein
MFSSSCFWVFLCYFLKYAFYYVSIRLFDNSNNFRFILFASSFLFVFFSMGLIIIVAFFLYCLDYHLNQWLGTYIFFNIIFFTLINFFNFTCGDARVTNLVKLSLNDTNSTISSSSWKNIIKLLWKMICFFFNIKFQFKLMNQIIHFIKVFKVMHNA